MRYAAAKSDKTGKLTVPNRLLFLRPPDLPQDDSDAEHKRYRKALAHWSTKVVMVMAVFAVAGAWALSPIGFARAGDLEDKINTAIEPLQKQQDNLKTQLNQVQNLQARDSRRLSLSLANGIASEIRFLLSKSCKEKDGDERERLYREISKKTDEYEEFKGVPFGAWPKCGEL
jgi:hypothetical protein